MHVIVTSPNLNKSTALSSMASQTGCAAPCGFLETLQERLANLNEIVEPSFDIRSSLESSTQSNADTPKAHVQRVKPEITAGTNFDREDSKNLKVKTDKSTSNKELKLKPHAKTKGKGPQTLPSAQGEQLCSPDALIQIPLVQAAGQLRSGMQTAAPQCDLKDAANSNLKNIVPITKQSMRPAATSQHGKNIEKNAQIETIPASNGNSQKDMLDDEPASRHFSVDSQVLSLVSGTKHITQDQLVGAPKQEHTLTKVISSISGTSLPVIHLPVNPQSKQGIEINLPDDTLGNIQLRAIVDKDGKIHATVAAETHHTRDMVQDSIVCMRSFLESEHVRVDTLTVSPTLRSELADGTEQSFNRSMEQNNPRQSHKEQPETSTVRRLPMRMPSAIAKPKPIGIRSISFHV